MLTVIMECRDQEAELAQTLSVLVAGAVEGLVSDVVVLDHGSTDGSSDVADAAGCRFHLHWDLAEIVRAARGEWLLLLEPGARPQSGWVEEIAEYMALNRMPARFSPSVSYRLPWWKRFFRMVPPLEQGFLASRNQMLAAAKPGLSLAEVARGQKTRRLASELIPSRVARSMR